MSGQHRSATRKGEVGKFFKSSPFSDNQGPEGFLERSQMNMKLNWEDFPDMRYYVAEHLDKLPKNCVDRALISNLAN